MVERIIEEKERELVEKYGDCIWGAINQIGSGQREGTVVKALNGMEFHFNQESLAVNGPEPRSVLVRNHPRLGDTYVSVHTMMEFAQANILEAANFYHQLGEKSQKQ